MTVCPTPGRSSYSHIKTILAEHSRKPLAVLNRDQIVLVTDDNQERDPFGADIRAVIISRRKDRNSAHILRIFEGKPLHELGAG